MIDHPGAHCERGCSDICHGGLASSESEPLTRPWLAWHRGCQANDPRFGTTAGERPVDNVLVGHRADTLRSRTGRAKASEHARFATSVSYLTAEISFSRVSHEVSGVLLNVK